MPMLENLPTVDEMIAALSSPIVPDSTPEVEMNEPSVEDMIKEIFYTMKANQGPAVGGGGCNGC